MFKKIISVFLCALLLGGLISCGNTEEMSDGAESDTRAGVSESDTSSNEKDITDSDKNKDDNENDGDDKEQQKVSTTIALNSATSGIKILGERYVESDSRINCDWTCSGIEFKLNSIGGTVTFKVNSDAPCMFRAYVDGAQWASSDGDFYYEVDGETEVTMSSVPEGEHVIRFIKVTGHTLARAELLGMTCYGTISQTAPADKELYIEFVGDSISCGTDILGVPDVVSDAYKTEDGSLAYPYLIANALNADYSVTALKGRGAVFGNPNLVNAYLLSSPMRGDSSATRYAFDRKADVVVINVETNDVSQNVSVEAFVEAYRKLIETVREKNGEECRIICLYNTMRVDTEIGTAIASLVNELGGANSGMYAHKMTHLGGGHPNVTQNKSYADILKPIIQTALSTPIVKEEHWLEDGGEGGIANVVISFSEKFGLDNTEE